MKASKTTDKIELAELLKLINRRKIADIRNNMERIEHVQKNGRGLKAVKRKLGAGKNQMYALRDKEGKVTNNMDMIVAEEFYRALYSSRGNQDDDVSSSSSPEEVYIPPVTTWEVKKALEGMKRGKAAGEGQVTPDLFKDGAHFILEKLATLHMKCLLMRRVPESWKNANIILIHKKGDVKDLKNYRPISVLSVVYKLFTKIAANRIKTH